MGVTRRTPLRVLKCDPLLLLILQNDCSAAQSPLSFRVNALNLAHGAVRKSCSLCSDDLSLVTR